MSDAITNCEEHGCNATAYIARIKELERELADVRELNEKYRRTNEARSDEIDRLEDELARVGLGSTTAQGRSHDS